MPKYRAEERFEYDSVDGATKSVSVGDVSEDIPDEVAVALLERGIISKPKAARVAKAEEA